MDENDHEIKSPIKRLGSTRKLLVFNNIRLQLNEQLRCLDLRMEAQVALVTELQDFFRRRGELELDYSKNLDKLAKSLQLRHKEQKQKREQWPLFSSYACWQQLVTQTRNLSREHVALSEVYSTHLVARLGQVMEDVQRIYKRCREIGYEIHEEILRVLHELHTTMKTYHSYQGELRQAEAKLRTAELQRAKCEQSLSQDKLERSKKYKLMEKEVMKRKKKYTDAKLKALKSRNEYILCLEASNTTIHKYFVDDLSDLIDCMDFGFHNCISRALLMHVSAEEGRQKSVQNGMDTLSSCINSLDSRLDKQKFLEYNHQAFMIPKKLEFQGQKPDDSVEPEIQKVLHQEMESRLAQLQQRVTNLRAESEEVWKTLETAESTLLEMLSAKDYDCTGFFGDGTAATSASAIFSTALSAAPSAVTSSIATQPTTYLAAKQPETVSIKLRADRQETEEFYLAKFREYLVGSTRIARLDAKQEYIRHALITDDNTNESILGALGTPGSNGSSTLKSVAKAPRRKRIGRLQMSGQPKLFAGSLEEYLEATNQEIPLIVKSCIRVINLFGLHHQGIFRVSGSQVEINNFREWFERGEDPLADMTDASDINSVAGVLKLYLRELREPLFPIIYFEQFMEISQLESKWEFKSRMRELVKSLPRPVMIVLRYIFAFLNHLAEYSDENMMDPYNLAICFGPTLVPVPDDKDQVQYQNQVNELIKNVIMFNDEIFPNDDGCVYEKYISPEPDDHDVGDSPSEQIPCDIDSEVCPSEDDSECMEATAQFDFIARSDRELSLKKGDMVTLYSQVSNDWWRGAINGTEGLIPDKYISLRMKDDDRDKVIIQPPDPHNNQLSNNTLHNHHHHHHTAQHQVQQVQLHHQLHHTHPPPHSHLHKQLQDQHRSGSGGQAAGSSSEESIRRASSSNDSALSESSMSANTSPLVHCAHINWQQISGGSIVAGGTTDDDIPSSAAACSSGGTSPLFQTQSTSAAAPATGQSADTTVQQLREINGHKKTRSMHCIETQDSACSSSNDEYFPVELRSKEVDFSNVNFSRNREQWQRRANSQSHIRVLDNISVNIKQQQRHSENNWLQMQQQQRQNHRTPDLVMDLPLSKLIPDYGREDAASHKSPDSPDMQTSAERFAKQNQCTLKKNTKVVVATAQEAAVVIAPVAALQQPKPQIRAKPAMLKKPSFSGSGAQTQHQPQQTQSMGGGGADAAAPVADASGNVAPS